MPSRHIGEAGQGLIRTGIFSRNGTLAIAVASHTGTRIFQSVQTASTPIAIAIILYVRVAINLWAELECSLGNGGLRSNGEPSLFASYDDDARMFPSCARVHDGGGNQWADTLPSRAFSLAPILISSVLEIHLTASSSAP